MARATNTKESQMDFNITCDDFETFQPTAEDFENDEVLWEVEQEEEGVDFTFALNQANSFFALVDSLNEYEV